MSLKPITYREIVPDILVRATWNHMGVKTIIQGVTHEQVSNVWVNSQGVTLIDSSHLPESLCTVEPSYNSDIIQTPCEPIEYHELSPGHHVHVIYASNETTTHFEGTVHTVTSEGVFTQEGGAIIWADDTDGAIIMRLMDEGNHNPAFNPVSFHDITKGMELASEWVSQDISYILYGTVNEVTVNGYLSAEGVYLANAYWDYMTYEVSDSRYVDDSLEGWDNVSLSEVSRGDLICIKQHLDDVTLIREGIVGDISGTQIFSLQGSLLFRGVGTIYRLPHYGD